MSHLDPWNELRRFTQARIALGRAGASLPTQALLDFGLAHARARDAVHAPLQSADVIKQLSEVGCGAVLAHSAAADRRSYLSRPDLGRQLNSDSRDRLHAAQRARARSQSGDGVVFVIADGLSAIATVRHAVPVFREVLGHLRTAVGSWDVGPVVVAELARVALGDEIGQILGAEQVVMLIGERPGLSAPDSLGLYLTYAPRPGRKDAERNCISNVRSGGLSYAAAARKLFYLMSRARQLRLSGIGLKDASDSAAILPQAGARIGGEAGGAADCEASGAADCEG
jgi:ethanolamine ammonia-lyase small subunit